MSKQELNEKLKIKEPFEYWKNQGYKFSKKIKLPVGFLSEALAIIKGAFNEQWICDQLETKSRGVPFFCLRKHQIVNCFLSPAESDLVGIIELAIYIKKLIHVKNLEQVLTQMKDSGQYMTGLLQLAFAYRFLKLGAKNIEFEPEARNGRRGDIYFELNDIPHMVECFISQYSYPVRTSLDILNCTSAIFDVIKAVHGRMRVCIKLKKSITPNDRRDIEKTTKELIREISGKKQISGLTECAEILVEDLKDLEEDVDFPKENKRPMVLYGGADWGLNNQQVTLSQIQGVRDGTVKNNKKLSRLFVWEPEEEKSMPTINERVEELTRKIEKKLLQTKRKGIGTKRIVITQIAEARESDKETHTSFKKIQNKIIKSHLNVAALILVSRDWMENFRYQYRGVFLMGKKKDSLSAELFNKYNELEGETDILQDRG
ncbi:hypothetical protein KAR91_70185 [Candidatus Pacearchaeota archaeon]|nr:hypothetical protein [Candidatus Pacearchaeota archaeon]